MRSYDLITMFKQRNGLKSDYKAAQALNISRAEVSLCKSGRTLSEDVALDIAQRLGIPESDVMALLASERCKTEHGREVLLSMSNLQKQAGRATAKLLFPLSFFALVVQYCILC
ncbi:hypothetical protein [uncultured Methylophaga sp.]|uniref:hypothetical protein n=1 Tax=uncultured Methylophaga sp. TaxID=285271 RepID=UPI0026177514|nr:hypothetical protein [uncultured Methylophaga sp.]